MRLSKGVATIIWALGIGAMLARFAGFFRFPGDEALYTFVTLSGYALLLLWSLALVSKGSGPNQIIQGIIACLVTVLTTPVVGRLLPVQIPPCASKLILLACHLTSVGVVASPILGAWRSSTSKRGNK